MPDFPAVDRLVLSSDISLSVVPPAMRDRTGVINSGFGFAGLRAPARSPGRRPAIAYLGTVDFKKLHRGIFDAFDGFDAAAADDLMPLSLWGHINAEVAGCAAAIRHPERIALKGHTLDPAAALAEADIFFYPLRPDHYGTAENALVEAMSLGLVPVVLDNPAETRIVTHGESGLVARSLDEGVAYLRQLARTPSLRAELAAGAVREAQTRSPVRSAGAFVALWEGLIDERNSMQVRQYA
jgi:glycosyltransferase involved in cell wall biosynthesis